MVKFDLLMYKIEREVKQKLKEKKSYKKRLKRALERCLIKILYKISNNKLKVKHYQDNSKFGCDEFGRDIKDGLRKYVKILKSRGLTVHTVVLLGSRAKGRWTPQSDVDVTIIASNLPKEGKNTLLKRLSNLKKCIILSDRPLYLGIEPSGCYSKEEFLKRLKNFDIQTLDAVYYGQIIYDDGFWESVKAQYNEMERKCRLDDLRLKELIFPL
jgi:predicted nucleotidyltransferase